MLNNNDSRTGASNAKREGRSTIQFRIDEDMERRTSNGELVNDESH